MPFAFTVRCSTGEKIGVVFRGAFGWHWIVTTGKNSGVANDAKTGSAAATALRNAYK